MSFFKMLPVLLLLPALTLADDDDKFMVHSEQFKVGSVMSPIANMAIVRGEKIAVSTKPSFPLKANTLYLRHKSKPKEYLWFSGDADAENFKKLYAYNLKENKLRLSEVVNLRFYASSNKKAFQDESDIYFDKDYLYSPRLPQLYFMKNGKWQMLKKSPFPGMVVIESNHSDLEITSISVPFDKTPRLIYPLNDDVYAFSFAAPNHLSYVDVGRVRHDDVLKFSVTLPPLASISSENTDLSVTEQAVAQANGLEETEVLYDKFIDEVQRNVGKIDTGAFNEIYPAKKEAASLDLNDDNKRYRDYSVRYDLIRQESLKVWRDKRLGNVSLVSAALEKKLDSLQRLPLSKVMVPSSIEALMLSSSSAALPESSSAAADAALAAKDGAVSSSSVAVQDFAEVLAAEKAASSASVAPVASTAAASSASVAPVDSALPAAPVPNALRLRFGADHGRFDVEWTGSVEGVPMDSLAIWLSTGSNDVQVRVDLVNDKPVWIMRRGELQGRHQYRYEKVVFVMKDKTFEGKGEFKLPSYIANEPEVREWLAPKPAPAEVAAKTDSASAVADTLKSPEKNVPEFKTKIVNDKYHGTVAVIDSGSFRFRGHVVEMSPFAIHTTEMTQEFFKEIAARDTSKHLVDKSKFVDPKKPVHNINWDKARLVCMTLGGDLPTEAQWEFAARAGENEGAPWNLDEDKDAGKYAVYFSNSRALGKADSAYGPQPVCGKKPNVWGLYDMSGNVAEWTRDKYFSLSFIVEKSNPTGAKFGSNKVYKGGSWKDKKKMLNMTAKDDEDPRYWSDFIGFRCVFPLERIHGLK